MYLVDFKFLDGRILHVIVTPIDLNTIKVIEGYSDMYGSSGVFLKERETNHEYSGSYIFTNKKDIRPFFNNYIVENAIICTKVIITEV